MVMLLVEITASLMIKLSLETHFAKVSMDQFVLNVPIELTSLMVFALLLTTAAPLGVLKMVDVLLVTMDSLSKTDFVLLFQLLKLQVLISIFIVLEMMPITDALDVSMDLLYKMEFVLLISKILHVEETQVSVETDSI